MGTIDRKPLFKEQVDWELDNLAQSDLVFMFLQGGTKSPISLLELGLIAASGVQTVVVCEPHFWRKGNVEIVCSRFENLELFSELDAGIRRLRELLED